MGALCKLVDAILLLQFVLISVMAPLIDSQIIFQEIIYPEGLVRLKNWFAAEFQDYLMLEKPHFVVGIIWHELVFLWPLALLNVYGILTSKPWFKTTCLIYGASVVTSMAALFGEILGSNKASDKFLMLCAFIMGFGVLALLRGLLTCKTATSTAAKGPALARKKRV
ncbi:Transmembrane protein 6/97 [Corchorus olitorius]|uniref:Transmembrane protein 6/97 n=1 Tax=Corchorus olitorius TaxID=93759 RepID=A0A1R3HQA3_9ROSI|nr:Transmembrane protein 6/97 [Corchorus olitorius]